MVEKTPGQVKLTHNHSSLLTLSNAVVGSDLFFEIKIQYHAKD
jgi:hypothetical protein